MAIFFAMGTSLVNTDLIREIVETPNGFSIIVWSNGNEQKVPQREIAQLIMNCGLHEGKREGRELRAQNWKERGEPT